MHLYFIVFTVAVQLSGCASFLHRDQMIAIDSTPRGLFVKERAETDAITELGTTPLVIRFPLQQQHRYIFSGPHSDEELKIDCQFRYGSVWGGNLAWALVHPVLAALGMGYDLINGNQWWCKQKIFHSPLIGRNLPASSACRNIMVLPPFAASEVDSAILLNSAIEELKSKPTGCHSFVKAEDSLQQFYDLNFGWHQPFHFSVVPKHKLLKLAFNLSIDTLAAIDFEIAPNGQNIHHMHLRYFDTYRNKNIQSNTLPRFLRVKKPTPKKTATNKLIMNALLNSIPDLMSFQMSSYQFTDSELERQSLKPLSYLGLSVKKSAPFNSMEKWSIDLGLSPQAEFYRFIWDINQIERKEEKWQLYNFAIGYGPTLNLRTTNLVFTIGYHFSTSMIIEKRNQHPYFINGRTLTQFSFSMALPFSEDYTFYIDTAQIELTKPIANQGFELKRFHSSSFGIGYRINRMIFEHQNALGYLSELGSSK